MAKKKKGSAKWIGSALLIVGMIYGFGRKTKAMEKDTEANATAIRVTQEQHGKDMELVREDLGIIKTDVKALLVRP